MARRRLRDLYRDERGVGLIELVTVLAVLGTVIGATVTLFVGGLNSEVDLTQRVRAQEQARLALERMRRDVHCASGVDTATHTSTSITLTMGAECVSGAGPVTWCTDTTGSNRKLYRANGTSCAGGIIWANYLTAAPATTPAFTAFFAFTPKSATRLATIAVDLPVDVDPADGHRAYRLRDALALRNSTRTP